jgi:hypothetical protein
MKENTVINKSFTLSALLVLSVTSAWADDLGKYQEESRATASAFASQLGAENKKAVMEGGPDAAVKVCKEIAPKMANEISRKQGWKLTRVSLKVRNPLLGTADVWEQKVLQDFEKRIAKGEKPETMEYAEIVKEPAGNAFRYMKAIALQPGCVTCHGTAEQIPENVKARLAEEYPNDKATGFAPGQLRGAISIKRAL